MNSFFKSRFQEVLFLAITLLAFIAFYIETDIYTPSFPQMVAYFGTNEETIQLLLSMNFLGLCLSCLFFGPASDAYGRKAILGSGLCIFMLGSIGCALTHSLQWMIFFRFLQGIGCGAIVSAGLAGFFDIYPSDQSSRLVSICNGTIGGMMALAPILGNWISLHWGWRANFYLIAVLAIVKFICHGTLTKETLPREKRTPLNLRSVFRNYGLILTNFPFMAHTLIWSLMFSMVLVFIANLSLIFIDHLHVPKEVFGYYQAAIMGAFFVGSMSGAYLIKKIGMITTKILGSLLYLVSIVSLFFLSYLEVNSPFFFILTMSLASLGIALAMTIYFSYSMSYIGENLKGSAMSLTQFLRLFLSSGLVGLAAGRFDGTTKPLSLLALLCTAMGLIFYYLLFRKKQHLAPDAKNSAEVEML
ncbi:MAG: multidrug effflux MFS transporter [Verrucomicrobia bacterium]|nr:multidrug effflux MFS transporter [Verrucomicrobiota bacterium]